MKADLVLEVRDLHTYFAGRHTLFGSGGSAVRAVDGVSFTLQRGEVLAIVGESGCGKTTIARTLIGLEAPTKGEMIFNGKAIGEAIPLKQLRLRVQMVFQDPYESLNPRATIYEIVEEPLVVHGLAKDRDERLTQVRKALEEAGLR